MKTFMKANLASLSASFCDYAVTVIVRELFKVDKVISSILGTTVGGIINFLIFRHWVFNTGSKSSLYHQSRRYLITWCGNLLLNFIGVYLLINCAGINMYVAKVAISLTVALAYNYPLQKKYVFKNK